MEPPLSWDRDLPVAADEALVAPWLERTAGGRVMLGLAGVPGSGKSTFAARLVAAAEHLAGPGVAAVVPQDGFHLPQAVLVERGWTARKGAPWTFDAAGFVALLQRLVAEPAVAHPAPLYDRERHDVVPDAVTIAPAARLLVVEGNYLLLTEEPWARVPALLDAIWYLDVPPSVARQRLLARHLAGGRSLAEAERRIAANDAPNAALIRAVSARADRRVTAPGRRTPA